MCAVLPIVVITYLIVIVSRLYCCWLHINFRYVYFIVFFLVCILFLLYNWSWCNDASMHAYMHTVKLLERQPNPFDSVFIWNPSEIFAVWMLRDSAGLETRSIYHLNARPYPANNSETDSNGPGYSIFQTLARVVMRYSAYAIEDMRIYNPLVIKMIMIINYGPYIITVK